MSEANTQHTTRVCCTCKQEKCLTGFNRQAAAKGGYRSSCKDCVNAAERARHNTDPEYRVRKQAASNAWKEKNLERVREYSREYGRTLWQDYPELAREKERLRAIAHPGRTSKQSREWEKLNPEKARESHRKWKLENPDKVRASARRRYAENPVKSAIKAHTRRVRMADGGSFTTDDITAIRKMQKNKCAICRVVLRRGGDIDHIIALAKGGTNNSRNLQLLCRSCNSRKSAKDQIDYMRSIGRLL